MSVILKFNGFVPNYFMSLEIFFDKYSINKEDWKKISSFFNVDLELSMKRKYMEKDFFLVEKNGKEFVPRVFPKEKKENFLQEQNIISFLNNESIKTSKALQASNGETFFEINNNCFCFFEKIIGEHYDNSDLQLIEMSKELANLHKVGKKFKGKKEISPKNNFDNLIFIKKLNNTYFDQAIERVKKANIDWNKLDFSLIHGDPHPGNVLFNKNKFAGFIDLEVARVDSTAFDLAWMSRTFTSKKGWRQTGEFDLERVELAKKEYSKIYKTNLDLLPELLLCNYIDYSNYKIERKLDIGEEIIQVKWILENY